MCLLERVVAWDQEEIRCVARSHRNPDNPLRTADGLPAVSGVEYAAQAMALHGRLCAGETAPRMGVLASIRNLELHSDWLHEQRGDLEIFARKLLADSSGGVYDFYVAAQEGTVLLSGRVTVMYQSRVEGP